MWNVAKSFRNACNSETISLFSTVCPDHSGTGANLVSSLPAQVEQVVAASSIELWAQPASLLRASPRKPCLHSSRGCFSKPTLLRLSWLFLSFRIFSRLPDPELRTPTTQFGPCSVCHPLTCCFSSKLSSYLLW